LTSAASVVTVPGAVALVHAPTTVESHGVSDVVAAVFATEAPAAVVDATVPPMVTLAVPPFATVGKVHETSWPVTEQEPVPSTTDAVTPLTLAGTVSTICTLSALEGPWLFALAVHWITLPATTGEVFSVLLVTRPASVVTVPGALGLRQAPATDESHAVSDVTVAEFATDAPAAVVAATVPPMTTLAVAALAIVPKEQETS
jgi:hypothetical protein